jgi:hypothetical protein
MPFTVRPNFIGSFKLGDNINSNLRTLALLYNYYEEGDIANKTLLRKPITIIIISIIEAVLHDFHSRIRAFTAEGVASLTSDVILHIKGAKIDELAKYIASAKKHDFFDMQNTKFYDALDDLRKLRNRIHIQNSKGDFEPNETDAFSVKRKVLAEKVLEKVLKAMNEHHGRRVSGYVQDFELPWDEYFPEPVLTLVTCAQCNFINEVENPEALDQCLQCGFPI